ncbi:MAG: STAS domain-containing protein [Verrucomicrobiia bacterium]
MTQQTLWFSQKEEEAYFQIRGKGSYKNACLFKDTTQDILNQRVKNLTIDFNSCTGLDSTFLGVLAGLALQTRQLNLQLSLVNLPKSQSRTHSKHGARFP